MARDLNVNNALNMMLKPQNQPTKVSNKETSEKQVRKDDLELGKTKIPERNTEKIVKIKPKKAGRPKLKTESTKNINVAVPISTYKKVNQTIEIYDNNLTKYINALIEKDLSANYEKYMQIRDQLRQLKQI